VIIKTLLRSFKRFFEKEVKPVAQKSEFDHQMPSTEDAVETLVRDMLSNIPEE
jgi:hypothetical protein